MRVPLVLDPPLRRNGCKVYLWPDSDAGRFLAGMFQARLIMAGVYPAWISGPNYVGVQVSPKPNPRAHLARR